MGSTTSGAAQILLRKYSIDNPAKGQFSVTSIVINRKFGGEIFKTKVQGKWHFYNKVKNIFFDFTYQAFVEAVNPWTLEDPGKSPVGGFILGGVDFVNWIKETFLSSEQANKEKPQLTALKSGIDIGDIISLAGDEFGIGPELILAKGKKRNIARDVAIYLSRKLTCLSGKDLGQHFGNISGAAIAMRYKAVGKQIHKDKKLRNRIKTMEGKIINN